MKKEVTNKDLIEILDTKFKTFETSIKDHIDEKIDTLAISTAKGFEKMATKDDIKAIRSEMATKQDIMNLHLQVNGIEVDIKSIKNDMKENLVQAH